VADNLADRFEAMAEAAPGRVAVTDREGRRRTYCELDAEANRVAHHLAAAGVRRDDAVGLVARNSIEWITTFLACLKLRVVPVNVNYRYVAGELADLFIDSGVVAILVDGDLVNECATAISGAAEPHHVVVIGADVGVLGDRAITYDAALEGQSDAHDFGPRSDDDVTMLYTGGTTGRPKGVVWRHADTYRLCTGGVGNDAAVAAARDGEHVAAAVVLAAGPFVHSSAQWTLLGSLLAGRTVVVLDRFDATAVWELCERELVTFLTITGDSMALPLLDALAGRPAPASIKVVNSSGGILSPTVKDALSRALPGAVLVDTLGSTETGMLGASPAAGVTGSTGLRMNGSADTIVVDDEGRPVPTGTNGMLAKSGYIPLRYHNDPEKTAKTFVTHAGVRYAISGDVARVEDDGTITVLGRQSSCINTGGEKVYPNEVEGVLKAHAAVGDCIVIGRPDPRWGQRVAAIIELRPRRTVSLDELRAHARETLAGYKVPRALCVVSRVERHPNGKPDPRWVATVSETGRWVEADR
jgi:acyl-CoA synthetase (AMP-forming)/AMP-acid ligase II